MTRRILSIDGGGIRGTFPAAFLASIEDELDHPIGSYFDLITGTSTGGIIAIGLAMGLKAQDILQMYEQHGPEIFDQHHSGLKGAMIKACRKAKWALFGPKYSTDALAAALSEVFGDLKIGDAKTRLMIPAWHAQTQRVYVYKTAHHPRLTTDYKDFAVDAALATSAAPTYFHQHITQNDVGLVDGGLWANNPTGLAVAEAIGVLGWDPRDLKVLSVSCLEDIFEMKDSYSARSIATKTADFFMAGQSYGSLGLARILTGDRHDRNAIYRICQAVPDGVFSLDGTKRIRQLKDRGFMEARDQKPLLKPVFFTEPAAPFIPEHKLDEHHD